MFRAARLTNRGKMNVLALFPASGAPLDEEGRS